MLETDFFTTHSVSIAKSKQGEAKGMMEQYFGHMKEKMAVVLHSDSKVDVSVFSETFTEDDFLDFVLHNIVLLLVENSKNCTTLVELICRVIYR